MNETPTLRERCATLLSQRALVERRLTDAMKELDTARAAQTDIDAVQKTVQFIAANVQAGFGNYVGGLTTKAIHHVFPERKKDSFVVQFRENRGKTDCDLGIKTPTGDATHPFHCAGGGVWDTAAFALRSSMLMLEQPAPSRILFLDEPFKFLHGAEWRRRALRMMYNTFVQLGIQAVVVHQSDVGSEDAVDESLDVLEGEPGVAVYEVRKVGYEKCEVVKV